MGHAQRLEVRGRATRVLKSKVFVQLETVSG
jgi:hypothetical protein